MKQPRKFIEAPAFVRTLVMFVMSLATAVFFSAPRHAFSDQWSRYTSINCVNDIAVSGDDVWCATDGGMVRWNIRDGSHEVFWGGMFDIATFTGVDVDDNGNLWCGRGLSWWPLPSLFRFDGVTWEEKQETAGHDVTVLTVTSGNVVWFGSRDCMLKAFDGSTLTLYDEESGYKGGFVDYIVEDGNGVIWVCANGLWAFDGASWTVYTAENSGLHDNHISYVAVDASNRLWIRCRNVVQCFDGVEWTSFQTDDEYPGGSVSGTADAGGEAFWLTGFNGGVKRYDDTGVTLYTAADGLASDAVICFDRGPDGVMYFGTGGDGFTRYDGTSWTTYFESQCPTSTYINDIAVDDNNVKWFATHVGAYCFDGFRWNTFRGSPIYSLSLTSVAAGGDGMVWFGTRGKGVAGYDGKSWRFLSTKDGLSHDQVNDLAVDSDNVLWVCTWKGISAFDGDNWRTYTSDDGLVDDEARKVAVDMDNVKWFGMDNNDVMSFDGLEWRLYAEAYFQYGRVQNIVVDRNNTKWFARGDFLSYDGTDWRTTRPDIHTYGPISVAADANGVIWYGLGSGSVGGLKMGGIICWRAGTWEYYDDTEGKTFIAAAVDHDNVKWFGSTVGLWSLDDRGTGVATQPLADEICAINGVRPNPFNSSAVLSFSLSGSCRAEVDIFNVSGQKVRTLLGEQLPAGRHEKVWDGRGDNGGIVSSGVYILRLKAGKAVRCARAVFVK